MSSNPLHITRSNYEEYFLLYIDNELSKDERNAVEAFALLHPDLGEELELLQGTTLQAPVFAFDDKESLLAESMALSVVDESLLLYIDNELPLSQQAAVEAQLHSNLAYKAQHDALLQTKLAPTDTLIYPYKEELYRRNENRRPLFWMRVAAAVLLVAGAGSFFALNSDNTTEAGLPVAAVRTTTNTPKNINPDTFSATPVSKAQEQVAAVIPSAIATKGSNKKTVSSQRMVLPKPSPAENLALQVPPSTQDRVPADVVEARLPGRITTIESGAPQQSFNTGIVTAANAPAYTTYTAAKTEPAFASSMETKDDKEQGSVRGLLRKATRFIERRTGIKATDEEDRLLVGAVAISLK
jgi:hypothetical protein